MRVAIALAVCMAAFTLTGCFEGPKGDKGDKVIEPNHSSNCHNLRRAIQEKLSASLQTSLPSETLTHINASPNAKRHVRFTPNSDRKSGSPHKVMSALPPKADVCSARAHVRFGP